MDFEKILQNTWPSLCEYIRRREGYTMHKLEIKFPLFYSCLQDKNNVEKFRTFLEGKKMTYDQRGFILVHRKNTV